MNYERIKELEKIADEFYKKLDDAYQNYEKNLEKEKVVSVTEKTKNKETKKKCFTENIFKEPPAWKPSNYYGKEFDNFKRLKSQDLDLWQISRINLAERSYAKEKDLPKGKSISYTKSYGGEFGQAKDLSKMSELGRNIISKFIKENEKKQTILKQKEDEIENYRHSKPSVQYNPWKSSNHVITEFSKFPGDKIHSFKEEKKDDNYLQGPFKIPKKTGDFFEKSIKLI